MTKRSFYSALFVAILLFTGYLSGFTQSPVFTVKSTSSGFNVEQGKESGQKITVSGKTFDLFETSNGALFVKGVSNSGKTYPIWIGQRTEFTFDGSPVFVSKKGTHCIYKLSKLGYPYPVWLNKE